MLQLSIENISLKFDELHQLKANNWRPLDPPERKVQQTCRISTESLTYSMIADVPDAWSKGNITFFFFFIHVHDLLLL